MNTQLLLPVMVGQGSDALETEIRNGLTLLEKEMELTAEADARINRPGLTETSLANSVDFIFHGAQGLIDQVEQSLGFRQVCQQVLHNRQLVKRFNAEAGQRLINLGKEVLQIQAEMDKLPTPPSQKRRIWAWAAVAALSATDGALALQVFQEITGSLVWAIPASIAYAGSLTVMAHLVPKTFALGKTAWQKWGSVFFWAVCTGVVFYWLASVRESSMNTVLDPTSTPSTASGMLPWVFTLVSLVMFGVSALTCWIYLPSAQQGKFHQRYRELARRKADIQQETERLEAELTEIQRKLKEMEQTAGHVIHRGRSLEQLIVTTAYRLVAKFKNINLRLRLDQATPVAFNEPYDFNCTLFFSNTINYTEHEN